MRQMESEFVGVYLVRSGTKRIPSRTDPKSELTSRLGKIENVKF